MKVSLNSIKKYVDINIATDELIQLIGSRLVEVEGHEDLSKKYANIYIVKVVECSLIEGTHLHLCQVEVGDALSRAFCDDGSNMSDEARNDGPEERPEKIVNLIRIMIFVSSQEQKGLFLLLFLEVICYNYLNEGV